MNAVKILLATIGVVMLLFGYLVWVARGDLRGYVHKIETKQDTLKLAREAVVECHDGKWCPRRKGCEKCGTEMVGYLDAARAVTAMVPMPLKIVGSAMAFIYWIFTGSWRSQKKKP